MSAEKKMEKEKLPRPEKLNGTFPHEEPEKGKIEKIKAKNRRVNYIIKDLPIY